MILKNDTGRYAWDDVNNMELPLGAVQEARKEEMTHMKENTFKVVKRTEAFQKTGKPPISTKSVDTDKSHGVGKMNVRSSVKTFSAQLRLLSSCDFCCLDRRLVGRTVNSAKRCSQM